MARGVASLIGLIGGVLIILGGIVSFILVAGRDTGSLTGTGMGGVLAASVIAVVLGILILVVSRPRFFWWRTRRLTVGIALVVLGAIVWTLVPLGVLVVLGSILTILAGAILVVEALVASRFSLRRIF